MININYWALLSAGLAGVIIGYMWYGPLFGKTWIKLMGFTKESMASAQKKGMTMQYLLTFVASFVMAYVLSHAVEIDYLLSLIGASRLSVGLSAAFWVWLGFIVPVTLNKVLWEGKSWKLWAIDSGYYLTTLSAMGAILSIWI